MRFVVVQLSHAKVIKYLVRPFFIMFMLVHGLCSAAGTQPVSLNFSGVPLITFAQAIYVGMLHRDYVISPDALAADRKITVQVRVIDLSDVPAFVENVLLEQGIVTTQRGGIYYLGPAKREAPGESSVAAPDVRKAGGEPSLPLASRLDTDKPAVDIFNEVYSPINRTADYLANVLAGPFGRNAVFSAGSRLILSGEKEVVAKMRTFLDALDTAPRMLDVSASWVEVTETDGSARGISLVANILGAKLGVGLGDRDSAGSITLRNTNYDLVINALNNDSRFKQISNSRIVGDESEKIALNVGDETPTLTSSGKDNAGNQVQNIVYRPSGVIVDVWARVLAGGRINLVVDGQISSFKQTVNGVSGSPTLIKRQVKTVVTVGDGDVLVIGGLTDTQATMSTAGFAFLPDSWKVKNGSTVKTDLVLILSAKASKI